MVCNVQNVCWNMWHVYVVCSSCALRSVPFVINPTPIVILLYDIVYGIYII